MGRWRIARLEVVYFNWYAALGNKAEHYWGEPHFGYCQPDDPWVIRKRVQMLTDADVDMLILDATTGFTYDAEREAMCAVLEQMKSQGHRKLQWFLFEQAGRRRFRRGRLRLDDPLLRRGWEWHRSQARHAQTIVALQPLRHDCQHSH